MRRRWPLVHAARLSRSPFRGGWRCREVGPERVRQEQVLPLPEKAAEPLRTGVAADAEWRLVLQADANLTLEVLAGLLKVE